MPSGKADWPQTFAYPLGVTIKTMTYPIKITFHSYLPDAKI